MEEELEKVHSTDNHVELLEPIFFLLKPTKSDSATIGGKLFLMRLSAQIHREFSKSNKIQREEIQDGI